MVSSAPAVDEVDEVDEVDGVDGVDGVDEEPERMAMRPPVGAEQLERGLRERDVAVLAPLAVDVEHLALAVDIRDLEPRAFGEAEPAGVDRREADAVDIDPKGRENAPDLIA